MPASVRPQRGEGSVEFLFSPSRCADNASAFENQQPVGDHRLPSDMRGDDDGPALHLRLKALKHIAGCISVETLGRLIQQPEWRVAQKQPRQRQTAGLTAGNSKPAFAKHGIQTCRQGGDELSKACYCKYVEKPRIVGPSIGKPEIVAQTVLKELCSLCQKGSGKAFNAASCSCDLASDQCQQCGLAGTARPDKREAFTANKRQRQVPKCGDGGAIVADGDILELNCQFTSWRNRWFGGGEGGDVRPDAFRSKNSTPEFNRTATQPRKGFQCRQRDQQSEGRNRPADHPAADQ